MNIAMVSSIALLLAKNSDQGLSRSILLDREICGLRMDFAHPKLNKIKNM